LFLLQSYWLLAGVEERKRALKTQGLSKIDGKCSAFMKVVVDSVSKEVNVEYNLSHIGHDTRLGHLRISDEVRSTIAARLAKGFLSMLFQMRLETT